MGRKRESAEIREEKLIMKETIEEKKRLEKEKKEQRREEKRLRKQEKKLKNKEEIKKEKTKDFRDILHDNPILKQKKLICFDLYGTLIFYPHSHKNKIQRLKYFGIKPFSKLSKISQTKNIDIKSAHKEVKGFKFPEFVIDKLIEHIANNIEKTICYDETLDVLKILKENGYSLGLVSNLSQEYEQPLRKLISEKTFKYEALSFKVGARKPKNKIFKEIKRQTVKKGENIEMKDMLMVGDTKSSDIDGAKHAGMDAILLDRKADKMSYDEKKNLIIIHTLYDLLDILGIDY